MSDYNHELQLLRQDLEKQVADRSQAVDQATNNPPSKNRARFDGFAKKIPLLGYQDRLTRAKTALSQTQDRLHLVEAVRDLSIDGTGDSWHASFVVSGSDQPSKVRLRQEPEKEVTRTRSGYSYRAPKLSGSIDDREIFRAQEAYAYSWIVEQAMTYRQRGGK